MKGLSIGVITVDITEASAQFLGECEIAELRYTPKPVP
jgi:hypothetical protein